MESEFSQEDMQKANRILKVRLRNAALKHIERVDARTLTVMENNDLFKRESPGPGEDVDPQIVADLEHPRRIPGSLGPLLVFKNEEPKKGCTVLEVPLLLYCEKKASRAAAFAHLERLANAIPARVTPRTIDFMAKYGDDLLSDDPGNWRPASVFIGDVVDDDILCSIAALKQALETTPALKDSVDRYGTKVLRPTVSSLDSIKLPIGHPAAQRSEIEAIIKDAVENSDSLEGACSAYFEALGHILLAPELSLAQVVHLWVDKNGEQENLWDVLWQWADTVASPLARYHVCSVFAARPENIPEDGFEDFWSEVQQVLCVPEISPEKPKRHSAWVLRCQLARHYTYHLETQLPDNDGANITCFAWWLAEQVAQVLSGSAGDINFYVEKWVNPEIDLSTFVWPLASSCIKHSSIRYPTLFVSQSWSLALNAQLEPSLACLETGKLPKEALEALDSALTSNLLFNYRQKENDLSEATYAFDLSLEPAFERWLKLCPDEHRKRNEALLVSHRKLASDDEFAKGLRKFSTLDAANQTFLAHVLRYRAYNGPPANDIAWECLSDETWREAVFLNGDLNALGLLFDALMAMQIDNGEKWFSDLPHFMAMACDKAKDDERRRHLFLYTLQSSVTSDTVSAIERLLSGENRAEYQPYVDEYRQQLAGAKECYPAWVKAKIRPYLATLHHI